MMSSEESGDDNTIIMKPLLWRAERVDRFFRTLDGKACDAKSPQAKRQTKKRVIGEPSTRPIPSAHGLPSWAFAPTAAAE